MVGRIYVDAYVARVVERIDDRPGAWPSLRVGVFRVTEGGEEQVGEYARNYSSLFDTFHPFTLDGRTYALYSPHYTATRVMELPSCRDLGGEEPADAGFCPADYYVPSYVVQEYVDGEGKPRRKRINDPAPAARVPGTMAISRLDPERREWIGGEAPTRIVVPHTSYPFGFVAGCIWGDDSSWKIQYLDLSEAASGRIRREERFGYVALPNGMRLRDAVDLRDYLYDGEHNVVGLTVTQLYELDTGAVADPFA